MKIQTKAASLKILFIFFALFTFCFIASAEKPKINKNPLKIEQVLANITKGSDQQKAFVTVYLNLAEKHKAYDSVFAVDSKNSLHKISKPEVAPLSPYTDKFSGGKERLVMTGEGTLKFFIKSSTPLSGKQKFTLTYQACTKEYCLLPKDISFEADFPVVKFARSRQDSNQFFSTEKFFANFDKQSTWLILLVVYLFGFLTAFTPCVFPMIPITMGILGFSDSSSRLKGLTIGFSYALGLSLTYAIVGVVVAMTGGFIGQALTNPFVIWGIFIFYVLTALAMAGIFTIKAPAALENSFAKVENKGLVGAFVTGALAGIIASPCVGPAVAAVLAYVAQSGKPIFGFFTLFAFGMGLGTLFILIGTFYGEINSRLKPGKWLGYVKYALAALILFGAFLFIKPHLSFLNTSHSHIQTKEEKLWTAFSTEAFEQNIQDKKITIIDFRADWCAACHELDKHTFAHEDFEEATKGISLLKFDATKPSAEQQKQLQRFEIFGLPTVLFVDKSGKTLEGLTLTGFEEWPDFKKRLDALKKTQSEGNF